METTPEIEEMFALGEAVFLEGINKLKECKLEEANFIYRRSELIIKKRLAVVEFVHGLELILKAILIRNDYCIYDIKKGLFKNNKMVKEIINPKKTIDLYSVIQFFKSKYNTVPFTGVEKLHQLRNQIIHKGTNIDEKKREYFIDAIACLLEVYKIDGIGHKKFLKTIETSKTKI